jgi:hypothetical protein
MHQKTFSSIEAIYKAKKAMAAAPMIPAAWVAWAAPPVNWEAVVGAADVGEVPLLEGVGVALTLDTGAADEATSDVTGAAEDTAAEEDGASDEAGASVVAGAAEDGAAEEASGTSMGTPAAAQVSSVAAIAAAWSAAEQACGKLVWIRSHKA